MRVAMFAVPMILTSMACASAAHRPHGDAGETRPETLVVGPEGTGTFIDGRSGQALKDADVVTRLLAAEVVLVGEHHGTPWHHVLQANLAQTVAVMAGTGRSVAAVEWLPHSARLAVRGWLGGVEPAEALEAATDWRNVWGHDFRAYAPFFERLRSSRIAIEPVNAEPGLARAVARGQELSVEQKELLPPLDSGTPAHRAWFEEQMRGMHGHHHHGGGQTPEAAARMERLYRAQLVWDETMGRHVLGLFDAGFSRVVVCAGMGHTTRGLGIAARLGSRTRLIVHPVETLDEALARAKDVAMPAREADIFWVPPEGSLALR